MHDIIKIVNFGEKFVLTKKFLRFYICEIFHLQNT